MTDTGTQSPPAGGQQQSPPAGGAQQQGNHNDDETQRNLRAARHEAAENRKRADALQAQIEELQGAGKTELEKAVERANKAEQTAKAAQGQALRYQVALAKGLPPAVAARLQGDTLEALQADADELMRQMGPPRVPDAGNHSGGAAPATTDANQFLRDKFKRR